jgi:hypothetical protein
MIKNNVYELNNKKTYSLFGLTILIILLSTSILAFADVVLDPVDPFFIKEGDIPEGEELDVYYYLEKGKAYHIFLVGEWVEDNTSRTDYDVFTYYPSNLNLRRTTHTEAAALPEQMANDEKHQYFVPEETGAHKFRILNDEENGEGAKAAIFQVIEHINLNTPYKKDLKGYNELNVNEKRELSVWSYEFRTRALDFEVFVDVSDYLDMYELRVYPMAYTGNGVGYDLNNLATPSGDLYNVSNGDFGGFNTYIDGFRRALASAEYSGRDMRLGFRQGENVSADYPTFYFLVLIGEWGQGSVEFFVKTDYSPPNITLIDPPIVGYTGEQTEIKVDLESKNTIDKVWVNYTVDDWHYQETMKLSEKDELYQVKLPPFDLHDEVKYKVFVRDSVDNENEIESSFPVFKRATINLGISSSEIKGGQSLKILGSISKGKSDLILNFTSDNFQQEIEIATDQVGEFEYDFYPTLMGEYTLEVIFNGDEDYYYVKSETKPFSVVKQELDVLCSIESNQVKNKYPLTIIGSVYPETSQVMLDLMFIYPGSSMVINVTTNTLGEFSTVIVPETLGEWQLLPQVKETELLAPTQGELITFNVEKLSIVDTIYLFLMTLISPPWVYGLVAIILIIIVIIELRTSIIRRTIRKLRGKEEEDEEAEVADTATSYRRRGSR